MICLGKDKFDERYNIDDNGIITDLQGNIQKTNISGNRPRFKSQLIHRIQMWTKYGWREPKIWHIHHKDENKFNNSIDNLVYLTRAEHLSLHHKGKQRSNKTKRKISENHSHYMKGKHLSEETKRKISEFQKRKWIEYHNSHK